MHRFYTVNNGFTAVELLVAIVIGVLMLSASYQLYSVGISSSGDAQRRTIASNAAYDLIRQRQGTINSGLCSTATASPAIPAEFGLPGATASVAVTCPFNEMQTDGVTIKRVSPVRLITATVTYDGGKQVVRAVGYAP